MGNGIIESSRQGYVVMKNEFRKFFSGKRMLIFLAMIALLLAILTVAPYLLGTELPDDPGRLSMGYIKMSPMIVLMAASLFASISIVSEYEERTALIIFTRPIRKVSIFGGKFAAAFLVNVAFTGLYYLVTAVVSLIVAHGVDPDLYTSFGLAVAFAFAVSGIATLFSSFVKKASVATIFTFVTPLIILPVVSMVLQMADMNVSRMLDQAAAAIANCSEAVRDMTNDVLEQLSVAMSDPTYLFSMDDLINQLNAAAGSEVFNTANVVPILTDCYLGGMDIDSMLLSAPDAVHDALVMVAWGVVATVIAFILFIRREF